MSVKSRLTNIGVQWVFIDRPRPQSEIPTRQIEPRPSDTTPQGIWDRDLSFEETHLNVSVEKIQAAIDNPNATYLEMDALWFSANNSNDHRVWGMLDAISERRAELIDKP